MPCASSARCSAVVPEVVATAKRVPQAAANFSSNFATRGPWTSMPEFEHLQHRFLFFFTNVRFGNGDHDLL